MKEINKAKREELIERREKLKTKISLERSLNGNLNCRDDDFEFFEKNNISYKVVHLENINDELTKECYLNYLENSLILKKINIDIEKLKEIKNRNPYTEFLLNKFPFDWTRNSAAPRLNLNELKNTEFHELEYNEINTKVNKIINKNKIVDNKVIIIWNNTLNLVIELNFKDFIKYSNNILCDIWDTWIYSLENDWCIEFTHDKELSFGRLKISDSKNNEF